MLPAYAPYKCYVSFTLGTPKYLYGTLSCIVPTVCFLTTQCCAGVAFVCLFKKYFSLLCDEFCFYENFAERGVRCNKLQKKIQLKACIISIDTNNTSQFTFHGLMPDVQFTFHGLIAQRAFLVLMFLKTPKTTTSTSEEFCLKNTTDQFQIIRNSQGNETVPDDECLPKIPARLHLMSFPNDEEVVDSLY